MSKTLFEAITDMDNLWAAWNLVARKKSAPGLDKVPVFGFGRDPAANLRRLHHQLCEGSYQPRPLRGVWVPKLSGGW